MGSGITAGSTLGYPIEHLTVAENCAPVLRAVRLFDPWNHGVATNSRVRIYREDARTVLKLSPQKYDVIISEPSNPWMVGIGRVFSREFYQLAASRLKPGGIMTQWFHLYEMDDQTLDVVVRTFRAVFPNMEIWDVNDGDIVMLGSDRPWKSDLEAYRRAVQPGRAAPGSGVHRFDDAGGRPGTAICLATDGFCRDWTRSRFKGTIFRFWNTRRRGRSTCIMTARGCNNFNVTMNAPGK